MASSNLSLSLSLLIAFSAGAFLSFVVEAFVSCDASALTQHSISISTDVQTLESTINTDPEGSMIIQKHVVTLNTDNPDGLRLVVSAKDDKIMPTYVVGSGPAEASGLTTIWQATGDHQNPEALSMNTFGFATAKETDVKYDKFSSQSVYESTNESVRRQAKFEELKELEYSYPFYKKEGAHVNKQIPIYYGTNVNSLMREGKYEVDVIYTVISHYFSGYGDYGNPHMEYGPKRMLVRDDQTFYGDNTVTIRTDIKSNRPIEADEVSVTVGDKECTDVNITQNFSENADKNLEVTCKAPKNLGSSAGVKYNIKIRVNVGSNDTGFEEYFGIKYVIPETMQGFQHSQCADMQTHEEKTLVDTRDGQLYTVAKLKDGKCWMTQNLRYQLSTTRALTPQDSDVQQNWTPNRSTETTLSDVWNQDSEGYKTVRSYYDSTKPEHGTYYTHTAATAGTTASMNNSGDEATGSICPKGWRLPKVRNTSTEPLNNDFYQMAKHYVNSNMTWNTNSGYGHWNNGTHNLLSSPQNLVYSGLRWPDKDGVANIGSYGYWWSSTVDSSALAYYLRVYSGVVHPRNSSTSDLGLTVRCIAREP